MPRPLTPLAAGSSGADRGCHVRREAVVACGQHSLQVSGRSSAMSGRVTPLGTGATYPDSGMSAAMAPDGRDAFQASGKSSAIRPAGWVLTRSSTSRR